MDRESVELRPSVDILERSAASAGEIVETSTRDYPIASGLKDVLRGRIERALVLAELRGIGDTLKDPAKMSLRVQE